MGTRILITGGAGFVGSNLAAAFRRSDPACEITAFDNLRRRGSELNLSRFQREGIRFQHGDTRIIDDLTDLSGNFDIMVEASAEPSVLAGIDGSARYLVDTNLGGTVNCMEFAKRRVGLTIFLSTSRVYSIQPLRSIRLDETDTRFEIAQRQELPSVSASGIAESFPTHLPRSLYGATKLASELLIQEYVETYHLKAVINRCGVICGPGQFGKIDQGVFTLWVANHFFGKPLRYTGFGGSGKQVRDLLHPDDLYDLISRQIRHIEKCAGQTYNVGGGRAISTSLYELTECCRRVVGREVAVGSDDSTTTVDIPLYLSDTSRVLSEIGWSPERSVQCIVEDIHRWLSGNERDLRGIFGWA